MDGKWSMGNGERESGGLAGVFIYQVCCFQMLMRKKIVLTAHIGQKSNLQHSPDHLAVHFHNRRFMCHLTRMQQVSLGSIR